MTIDEMQDELDKLKGWLGGNGSAPVTVNGFELEWGGKVQNGCAAFTIPSHAAIPYDDRKALETALERVGVEV